MPSASHPRSGVAIVGASSLLGKELKAVLEDRNFPAGEIILLDESEAAGTLTEASGEPAFIRTLEEDSFEHARFAFFAGSRQDALRNMAVAERSGSTVIDMTGAAAQSGRATMWIPSVAPLLAPVPGTSANGSPKALSYFSPAAPVIISCALSAGLARFSPVRLAIQFFPPVSEHGQPGIDELETQTAALLSFQPIAKPLFDAQVAFNLLASYGPESKASLEELRESTARDSSRYLAGGALVPAVQFIHVPAFFGYAFSAFAEFPAPLPPEPLEASLAAVGIKLNAAADAASSNAGIAGENEIHIASIAPDLSVPSGVWIWGLADNLRLAALNAVRIAEELLANE
ncbi:MAG: Asd/ArgC dimerization domain-containing protein [Candidatus Acidiferrales bacterium]